MQAMFAVHTSDSIPRNQGLSGAYALTLLDQNVCLSSRKIYVRSRAKPDHAESVACFNGVAGLAPLNAATCQDATDLRHCDGSAWGFQRQQVLAVVLAAQERRSKTSGNLADCHKATRDGPSIDVHVEQRQKNGDAISFTLYPPGFHDTVDSEHESVCGRYDLVGFSLDADVRVAEEGRTGEGRRRAGKRKKL